MRRRLLLVAAFALVSFAGMAPSWAKGTAVSLGLGADYWTEPGRGAFSLTLGADTPLARHLTLGVRAGALVATDPNDLGVPLDLRLRARISRLYFEGLVGPWILFTEHNPIRAHAGFGFGLQTRSLSFGLEAGWVTSTPSLGLRLAFPL